MLTVLTIYGILLVAASVVLFARARLALEVMKAAKEAERTLRKVHAEVRSELDAAEAKRTTRPPLDIKTWHRTDKSGETLSDAELALMVNKLQADEPACIDCFTGMLLMGPSGGSSVNLMCSNKLCGSRFNVSLPFFGERLTEASPMRPRFNASTQS